VKWSAPLYGFFPLLPFISMPPARHPYNTAG
jgi:hypothetical protein